MPALDLDISDITYVYQTAVRAYDLVNAQDDTIFVTDTVLYMNCPLVNR